jgi:hypothetical protein
MMSPATGAVSRDNSSTELLNALIAEGMAPKIQARHLANHHLAEQMYLARHKLADAMGMDDAVRKQITPFPTPTTNTTVLNDNAALVALLERMMDNQTQAPAAAQPAPTPTPAVERTSSMTAPWRKGVWGAIAAAAIATAGGTAYALWPAEPAPAITAELEAIIR